MYIYTYRNCCCCGCAVASFTAAAGSEFCFAVCVVAPAVAAVAAALLSSICCCLRLLTAAVTAVFSCPRRLCFECCIDSCCCFRSLRCCLSCTLLFLIGWLLFVNCCHSSLCCSCSVCRYCCYCCYFFTHATLVTPAVRVRFWLKTHAPESTTTQNCAHQIIASGAPQCKLMTGMCFA